MVYDIAAVEQFFEDTTAITYKIFEKTNGGVTRDILLAGIKIRLKFSDLSLLPLILPAIEQITSDFRGAETAYTIFVWDSFSSGAQLPKSPVDFTEIHFNGELNGFNNQRFETAYFTHAHMLSLLDADKKVGIICMADVRFLPGFEMACPFRAIFNGILKRHNVSMAHAGAVGNKNGAALIVGHGGAGKSSTALRCLLGGLDYFGDDVCAIAKAGENPVVYSMYSSGKIHNKDLSKFAAIKSKPSHKKDIEYEKEIFFLAAAYKNYLPLAGNIKVVLLPDQQAGAIGFSSVSPANVLSIVCSSTKMLLPNTGNEVFLQLASILRNVPFYKFHLGPRPEEIAGAVDSIINKLAS